MSGDKDALDRLVVTIVSVKKRLGVKAYRAALSAARQAVAALVLREAERRAGSEGHAASKCEVVDFLLAIRKRDLDREIGGE